MAMTSRKPDASQSIITIDSDQLAIGMYVCELDRPWLDAPFDFQGFLLRDAGEVLKLKSLCRRVRIDVSLGDSPTGIFELDGSRNAEPDASNEVFRDVPREPKANRTPLDHELQNARQIQLSLATTLEDAMEGLRAGRIHTIQNIQQVSASLIDSIERNPDALSWLTSMRSKDAGMYRHAMAVGVLVLTVGRHLGLPRQTLENMALGGLLFDVGKTRVSDTVLMKPDRLTEKEYERFQRHVEHGLEMLSGGHGINETVLSMVRTHHERHDGSGYPAGLMGDSIPALGKIVGIADTYETMLHSTTSGRRLSPHDVLRYFNLRRDRLFDGALVEEFIQAIGIYPTGTLVKLNDKRVGVIYEQNRLRRLRPRVLVVLSETGERLKPFERVDLLVQESLQIVECLEPGSCGIDPEDLFL
jgi:HD-GYP domain-containing protein (c-di-GMP phosphodiesterase class II)